MDYLMIYGADESNIDQILQEFLRFGDIVEMYSERGLNWVIIKFASVDSTSNAVLNFNNFCIDPIMKQKQIQCGRISEEDKDYFLKNIHENFSRPQIRDGYSSYQGTVKSKSNIRKFLDVLFNVISLIYKPKKWRQLNMNSDDKNKGEEVGLPKSTLCNYIKELLSSKSIKGDKNIFQTLEKITTRYVNQISMIGSQICTEKGKKTLNVEHVISALKQMRFDKHIKMITNELDLNAQENEENEKYEDEMEVKDLIIKQKKKSKKRRRTPEFNEDMANEQEMLFEQAKMNMILLQTNTDEILQVSETKKMRLEQIEKDLFESKNNEDDDVDFDSS